MEQQKRGNIPGTILCDEFGKPYADDISPKPASDPSDYDIPGLDETLAVAGGVDVSNESDDCEGGGCKI